jgi:alpha-mannosidase
MSLLQSVRRLRFVPMASPSRITLVAHTHWDREWYEPFEVFRTHLVEMLDEALDHLERDARLHFTLDGHVALVDDYLELRPANEERVRALVSSGRLHIGPWYTQADTLLSDGEALIRNLAAGVRRAELLGGAMRLGYMPDQFGHAAQMPQLLRMFGIDGAVLWRGVGPERPPHAFRWQAPDGSHVTALWLQDGYGSGRRLPSDPDGFAEAVDRALERVGAWAGEMPVLFPVGDDHVRLAHWLPEAADAVKRRHPEMEVTIGGYQHHLPSCKTVEHVVRGELRSPAFAPVLAGVASARVREKQMCWRATNMLLRYAEPLWTMARQAGSSGGSAQESIARAWKQLLQNHAHDSAAGCGVDEVHEDVRARFRWAEQLAATARDRALAQLRIDAPVVAFHPGPAAAQCTVETQISREQPGALVAVGADGIARPVQLFEDAEAPPVFEGEFPASELSQYLGGLDPSTPLFGKYLSGIRVREESPGVIRLDVGLGEHPAPRAALAADQQRVQAYLANNPRFHVVLHSAGVTRRALVQMGPAPGVALVTAQIRAGEPDAKLPRASKLDDRTIAASSLRVIAEEDGSVIITDETLGLSVRANDLVDEGDRGDLYHFDGVGAPIRARSTRTSVVEAGPVRARLRIEQEFELPRGLHDDRSRRDKTCYPATAITEVTLTAGERRVEFDTRFHNDVRDHRLRALCHAPFRAERLDVEHGLAVVARPLDPESALGRGSERAAPTGQHHAFADVTDGRRGVALMSRGLVEHEVLREDPRTTQLALTLLRAVGWLSRGDLKVIDHAAGPMVPTPGAQELGAHRFEYALVLHEGDWRSGGIYAEARRWHAPPIAVAPRGRHPIPADRALVTVTPTSVALLAVHPAETGRGVVVRLLNASPEPSAVRVRAGFSVREAVEVDPLEQPVERTTLERAGDDFAITLGAWKLATILLRS